jgi:hypothetical protein
MEKRRGACKVLWGNLSGKGHMEDLGLDGRIILKWIFEKLDRGVDWIDLAQYREKRRPLVNTVINLFFSIKCGEILNKLRKY